MLKLCLNWTICKGAILEMEQLMLAGSEAETLTEGPDAVRQQREPTQMEMAQIYFSCSSSHTVK